MLHPSDSRSLTNCLSRSPTSCCILMNSTPNRLALDQRTAAGVHEDRGLLHHREVAPRQEPARLRLEPHVERDDVRALEVRLHAIETAENSREIAARAIVQLTGQVLALLVLQQEEPPRQLADRRFSFAPLREIARDFGEPEQLACIVPDGGDNEMRPVEENAQEIERWDPLRVCICASARLPPLPRVPSCRRLRQSLFWGPYSFG